MTSEEISRLARALSLRIATTGMPFPSTDDTAEALGLLDALAQRIQELERRVADLEDPDGVSERA